MSFDTNRRTFLAAAGALAIGGPTGAAENHCLSGSKSFADAQPTAIRRVRIPKSGELLPVIGLGTSRTFDADPQAENAQLIEVMQRFYAWGGSLIDSSPMYRRSEEVVGVLNKAVGRDDLFYATKVWTDKGREAGIQQMHNSEKLMGTPRFDLMQVHNLVGLEVQLQTLKEWREQGKVRYLGVTEMKDFETVEKLVASGEIDFIQIPYSVGDRRVESRLLPACIDHGVAVLVMRPYERGKFVQQGEGPANSRMGGGIWGGLLGTAVPQVHSRPPSGDAADPGHQ